jgi:predicted GNAT family N-acyltransferase
MNCNTDECTDPRTGYVARLVLGNNAIHDLLRLRFEVFRAAGFITLEDYPDGTFADPFDRVADQLGVYDARGDLIATSRLVPPNVAGLPIEQLFSFDRPSVPASRIGEWGRLAVRHEQRGGGRHAMLILVRLFASRMARRRLSHVLAFMPPALAGSFSQFGRPQPLVEHPVSPAIQANRARMGGYFANQEVKPYILALVDSLHITGEGESRLVGDLEPIREPAPLGR